MKPRELPQLFIGINRPTSSQGLESKVVERFFFDADWGELDFMLVDLPPGTEIFILHQRFANNGKLAHRKPLFS
jgi:hypothetical protein